MVIFSIRYEARNVYEENVYEAFFEYLVSPCNNEHQQLIWEESSNSADSMPFRSKNVFGYDSISFRLAGPFNAFNFKYACDVRKDSEGYIPLQNEFVNISDEQLILESESFQVDHYQYINQTPLTEISIAWIPEALRFHKSMYLLDYVKQLNQHIHQHIQYASNRTTVQTTAREIWFNPMGVCQDYSHLMLGILRSQHIPARYVSGYLNQGKQFIGSAQMHAWIEVYLPKYGWLGLDPTNNLWADYHHIKVADGQDYKDCSPLNGYIKPSGFNTTDHSVEVIEQ